ncbi:MAG: serine/threonine protein kinase [Planctomycetes bacterium]|nr:serine/threonine protein kinase [Planctomycetota bacterium]
MKESAIAQRALVAGLVSPEELDRCRASLRQQADGASKSLLDVLVRERCLTAAQAQRLRQEASQTTDIPGYQLLEKLGQGSMGMVYKARQLSMNRVVAIKVLHPRLAINEEFIVRFRREAQVAGQLSNNHIVQAIDTGESQGRHYFVMEYVEGFTIQDELDKGKVYEEAAALGIVLQVAEALEHAHRKGLVHRDIKPDNIMIAPDGTVKLADMGLARPTADTAWAQAEQGLAIGTPYYISPEQVRGLKDIDIRADIYSLGATLYHMVTGKVPFPGKTREEVMVAHLKSELVPPDHINQRLSSGLGEVVETMMAKDRRLRYPSPQDLILDLRNLQAGRPPLLARQKIETSLLADLAEGEEAGSPADVEDLTSRLRVRTVWLVVVAALLGLSALLNLIQLLSRR